MLGLTYARYGICESREELVKLHAVEAGARRVRGSAQVCIQGGEAGLDNSGGYSTGVVF